MAREAREPEAWHERVPGERCPRWHNRPSVNAFEDLAHCGWCDEKLIDGPGIVKPPVPRRFRDGPAAPQ